MAWRRDEPSFRDASRQFGLIAAKNRWFGPRSMSHPRLSVTAAALT
jgi:hypothetical protein